MDLNIRKMTNHPPSPENTTNVKNFQHSQRYNICDEFNYTNLKIKCNYTNKYESPPLNDKLVA